MSQAPTDVPSPAPAKRDAYAAFRSPAYRSYAVSSFVANLGRQMLGVALGYEIFQRTHSATALGLVGLMGALPIIFLSIPAGITTDRMNRKVIILITQLLSMLTSIGLTVLAWEHVAVPAIAPLAAAMHALYWMAALFGEKNGVIFEAALPLMYLLLFINGISRAFGWAARSALFPNLVPRSALSNAVMWNSSNFELTCVLGPALGGLAIAHINIPSVYALDACCGLIGFLFILPIFAPQEIAETHPHPLEDLFTGLRFVCENKIILATITLDLFAVLLGGALALLPIFADRILGVGAVGLGWLRTAPSIGAVLMAFILAHRPPLKKAGDAMLLAVAGFGVATIIFGLSHNYALSFVALAFTGCCDNVSVVVRHTLVQLLTPDAMRGRVSAVNNIFIGSSNEVGAFESGITAALFGPVLSVVGGGIGTIFVVLGIAWKWPQVRQIGPLQTPEKSTDSAD
ncbi:major facilitator superfamily MFS_1 [Chthoniobacter flavus Ellin428]|uniref:Major facilitator superfamily MFS_1 n=1 Tax=Chthoniobacter flavus Ellin428 TaxID=497964 RepID=B4CYD0_9BACT|nr:MFS transporter [Chthoniobacter flavus]EDY20471.1 major facilitator superfamily MFS_1 [Chthoniobacter flavus Ellin428]TCO85586.1 putative MFS family arabinose efflux permease [Chthoniobacter flavus]